MRCYNGVPAEGRIVPCGQCMNCRINAGRIWTGRILMEHYSTSVMSWFMTFTYRDSDLEVTPDCVPTLRKRKFQTWIDNAKRDIGPFRYYAVGEYGTESLRPHYHMALFPDHDRQVKDLADRWNKGFTSAYDLSHARARYLAQYTTKKLTSHTDERLEAGQEPEFRCSSGRPALGHDFVRGIASTYRTRAGKRLLKERGDVERVVRFGSKVYPIAPFWLGKLRAEFGIPARHADRLAHPGYYEHFQSQEAEQCPTKHEQSEVVRNAQKKRRVWRTATQNI